MALETSPTPKLDELLSTYDDSVLEVVHEQMREFNTNTQDKRVAGHPDTQAILDEAHLLQAQAQREGEVHIVERHRSGPRIFFAQGESISYWEAGQIKTTKYNSKGLQFDLLSSGFNSSGNTFLQIREKINTNHWRHVMFDVEKDFIQPPAVIHIGQLHDILFINNELRYLTEYGPSLDTLISPENKRGHKLGQLYVLTDTDGNEPRMAWDRQNKLFYFIHRGAFIGSLQEKFIKNRNGFGTLATNVKEVLNSGQVGQPVDLEFDGRSNLLLIQDAKARTLFAHNPNQHLSRPNFESMDDYLELPPQALQSGKDFSLCCWIDGLDKKAANWQKGAANLSMLQLRINDKKETEWWFYENGEIKSIKDKVNLTKGWNHMALVKEGTTFRVFVNGELAFTKTAPTEVDTYMRNPNLFFRFSVPGYKIAELSLWSKARTMQEIRDTMRTWLTGHPDGLSAYWRLENRNMPIVKMENDKAVKSTTYLLDYSGNNFHGTVFKGGWKKQKTSPLSPMLPLYRFDVLRRGISIDQNTGHLYWVDLRPDGEYYIMKGSVYGNIPAIPLAPVESNGGIVVESAENNPYEKLILAHAHRREAIREAMEQVSHAHEAGHTAVQAEHTSLDAAHEESTKQLNEMLNNRSEHNEVQNHWMRVSNDMHAREKSAERAAADRRLSAIEKARTIVAQAHEQANTVKRNAALKTLNERRNETDSEGINK